MDMFFPVINGQRGEGWDLNSDVPPPVPAFVSSKYKVSWRNAKKTTRKSRVKDYAAYMMDEKVAERNAEKARRLQINNFMEDAFRRHDKYDDIMEEADRKHREFYEFKDETVDATKKAFHAHNDLKSLTKNLKIKQQADVDDLQKQVTTNASMINQLCGFMRGMKINGLQEQMGQTSMSEHAGRTKAVKWAVVEEDD